MFEPFRRWMRDHPEHMPAVWAGGLYGGGAILLAAFLISKFG